MMTVVKEDKDKDKDTEVTVEKKFRIAVYGSLRRGLHNYDYFLKDKSELVGTFTTTPEYTMYSVGGGFPALINKGYTPVVMEVYDVDEEVMDSVDALEGFRTAGDPMNLYEKTKIMTPYGEAWMYLYNEDTSTLPVVESGDWYSFKKASDEVNNAGKC